MDCSGSATCFNIGITEHVDVKVLVAVENAHQDTEENLWAETSQWPASNVH